MTYLFVQTLVIQFLVGIAFLLLGLWGGKFLWGHDRHYSARRAEGNDGGAAAVPEPEIAKPNAAEKKALAELRDEVRQLRLLNGKLEKKNRALLEKAGEGEPGEADAGPAGEVAEGPEVIEMFVEGEAPPAKPEKPEKQEKPEKAAKAERDELIRIRGIGKVMAVNLEKRGIRTYRQIAGWTKEEIEKLPYGSRVIRDKWQIQARRLHKEKYGERI